VHPGGATESATQVVRTETRRRQERIYTAEEVTQAVREGFEFYRSARLGSKEQEFLRDYELETFEQTLAQDQETRTESAVDAAGNTYLINGRARVSGLMTVLAASIKDPEKYSITADERTRFQEIYDTLSDNSSPYLDGKAIKAEKRGKGTGRKSKKSTDIRASLIGDMLQKIDADPRFKGKSKKARLEKATEIIQDQREIYLPKPRKTSQTSTELPAEPTTPSAPSEIPAWVTRNGTGDIPSPVNTSGNAPWLTQTTPLTFEGLANGNGSSGWEPKAKQDEAPWGKPDLPKGVEVRTSQLPEEIIRDAQARKDAAGTPPRFLASQAQGGLSVLE
jgi:hypothetical protein